MKKFQYFNTVNININQLGENMTNIKKIGLSALAGSLVALSSATAGEMAVSGSAGITFGNSDEGKNGTYHTMGNSINFDGSGELDNGMTVSLNVEFDGDEGDDGEGLDNHSITIDTNGMGVVKFVGHGGAGVLDAWDDKMPTAYEEPWDAVSGADSSRINGAGDNDAFGYTSPEFNGVTFLASYSSGQMSDGSTGAAITTGQKSVYTDWGVQYTGVEGLTVGYAEGTTEDTAAVENDESTIFVTYAFGPVTVGAQRSDFDSSTNANDKESEGFGISYAVNDDLSISYGVHTIDFDAAASNNSDQESSAIGFSYSMGSIYFGGTMNDVDNVAGAAATDREGYEFHLSFAF